MGNPVTASPSIRFARIDGLIVILDLKSEDFYLLDERASERWDELLAGEGDVSRSHDDDDPFFADCLSRAFLIERNGAGAGGEPSPRRGPARAGSPRFLTLRAWWSLFVTGWSLRRHGFARTYRRCESIRLATVLDDEPALVRAAQAAFLRAENLFWFTDAPRDCLPRSLALFRFLRSAGLSAEHRIGGRRFPSFAVHAWVSCSGSALLDNVSDVAGYTVIARIPAT